MKQMIGYCGLDCEKCSVYLATVNHDEALRKETAELWSKLNGAAITPEMLYCEGCRAQGVKTYYCSDMCAIRRCAADKGYETCADCAALSGCGTVAAIHDHSKEAVENLKRI